MMVGEASTLHVAVDLTMHNASTAVLLGTPSVNNGAISTSTSPSHAEVAKEDLPDPSSDLNSTAPETTLSVEEYGNLLDEEEEDKPSQFEKRGDLILSVLKHELHQIKGGKSVPTTRLYDYQIEAVLNTANHFKKEGNSADELFKKALIVGPPGSGKSGMVTLLPYALKSKKVLILTPSKIISEQLAAEFGLYMEDKKPRLPFFVKAGMNTISQCKKLLEPVQLAQSTHDVVIKMRNGNLVIVNAQKFAGNSKSSLTSDKTSTEDKQIMLNQLDKFDTIIVDEAHHYPAATWETIVNAFTGKKVIFLTATPYRGTEEKALKLLGALKVVYEISRRQLEGITIRKTEFSDRPADSEILIDPIFLRQLGSDITDILDKHRNLESRVTNPQALVLVGTKVEAKAVALGLGSKATFIIADKSGEKNLKDFSDGVKEVAVVCGMLREGYDNSNVTLVAFLRKCRSSVLFEQFCGRCIRMHRTLIGKNPDKTVATVLSYVHFDQSRMWAARCLRAETWADSDPVEEDNDED